MSELLKKLLKEVEEISPEKAADVKKKLGDETSEKGKDIEVPENMGGENAEPEKEPSEIDFQATLGDNDVTVSAPEFDFDVVVSIVPKGEKTQTTPPTTHGQEASPDKEKTGKEPVNEDEDADKTQAKETSPDKEQTVKTEEPAENDKQEKTSGTTSSGLSYEKVDDSTIIVTPDVMPIEIEIKIDPVRFTEMKKKGNK